MSRTTQETETMEAGREMDALVAEKVMGLQWRRFDYPPAGVHAAYGKPWTWLCERPAGDEVEGDETRFVGNITRYSTDIAAAWLVIAKLMARGWYPEVAALVGGIWRAEVRRADPCGEDIWEDADTAPLAICRAALATVEVDA